MAGRKVSVTSVKCLCCGEGVYVLRRRLSDGVKFWGCSNYPECRASLDIEAIDEATGQPVGFADHRQATLPGSGEFSPIVPGMFTIEVKGSAQPPELLHMFGAHYSVATRFTDGSTNRATYKRLR